MGERRQLNLRMPSDLYERLRANAEDDDRSINGQVCYIVRQYLDGARYGVLEVLDSERGQSLKEALGASFTERVRNPYEALELHRTRQALNDQGTAGR